MIKNLSAGAILLAAGALFAAGCGPSSTDTGKKTENGKPGDKDKVALTDEQKAEEAKIHESLAKLSAEDRKLAEEQKYCAIQTKDRLGEMGAPKIIKIKGETVFLCCSHCEEKAMADEEKTLDTVKELKEKAAKEGK
jgi:hypothetical protein